MKLLFQMHLHRIVMVTMTLLDLFIMVLLILILQVFDTWGTLIYTEESSTNELNGWDGKINGRDAENGNYFLPS